MLKLLHHLRDVLRLGSQLDRIRQERARLVYDAFDRKPGHQVAQHKAQALTHAQLAAEIGWKGRGR